MIFSEIGPNTLNTELNRYLENTRLSLSQVAKRINVSKGHLSEIKNGKAQPALNTGLRILKICGLEIEQRKAWAHFYNTSISDEYLEVHDDWEKENARKLNEKVSFLLARDLDLMNAYVDIVGEEDTGIALVDLRLEYGRSIEKKLNKLVEQNVVEIEQTDLGKVFKSGKVDPIMTKNSSYDLMKTVIDDQQLRYQDGDTDGKFKFHINDIDKEGYKLLSELLNKTMKDAEQIMLEHKLTRKSGGKRYAFEILLGKLKTFIIFALMGAMAFTSTINDSLAQSGGLSGGSSRVALREFVKNLPWSELEREENLEVNWPELYMSGEFIKLNNLCHNAEAQIIRTIDDVLTCTQTQFVKRLCWMEVGQRQESCIEYNTDPKFYEDNLSRPYSQIVTDRECIQQEYKSQAIDLKNSGVFVRFNNPNTGRRENHHAFQEDADGNFGFEVEVYQQDLGDSRGLKKMITTKNYQLPSCL